MQRVTEFEPLLVLQLLIPGLGRLQRGVSLGRPLLVGWTRAKQGNHCGINLVRTEYVEVIKPATCVPKDVRIGRWGDGATMELFECLDDDLGVVSKVENESVLF